VRFTRYAVLLVAVACSSSSAEPASVTVRMDFTRPTFFAAPFPSDDLVRADGGIALDKYPNPDQNALVTKVLGVLSKDARGFATSGGAFLAMSGVVDPTSLPDLTASTTPASSVALVSVEDGKRFPAFVAFEADGGPFGDANLLSIVPLQGVSLPPKSTIAAVATRGVRDDRGRAIAPSAEMQALARGERPAGMNDAAFAAYGRALATLEKSGIARADVAGLAVFTTGDPAAQLVSVTHDAIAAPLPTLTAPPVKGDVFDNYCVYNATVAMPDYQAGTPPYPHEGGGWALDPAGHPIVQRTAPARIVLSVPRTPAPASGYPVNVLVRTGAGGDRPLVDRGAQATNGGPPITPGSGPAMDLARIGFAGAQIDGPMAGARNPSNDDEQFLIFNVENPISIRDSVRESALELVVFERILETLTFDASACAGASTPVKFDASHMALMGHSMGATIAPLALAAEPRYGAGVLGGAGASWLENVLFKQKPLVVRPLVEILLGYRNLDRTLQRGDPVLTLVQWAIEPADPLVYAPLLAAKRHILVQQGIVDHYIMPTIANALALALDLDLAGDALDAKSAELTADPEQRPLASVLQFSGRAQIPLPASANASGMTAVVRQYPEDGIEDGHEVMFQTQQPKSEYACFLATFAKGAIPVVTTDKCP
jgi:hypothetical protein